MDGAAPGLGGLADWQIGPVAVRKRADVSKTPVTAVNGPGTELPRQRGRTPRALMMGCFLCRRTRCRRWWSW